MSEIPWFKVDDNLAFHHKVVAAGNPAIGLWARAGSLCAQQLTDGFVPDHMVPALGTIAQAKRLVTVGLWDRVQGGYRFHGWDERQPSKAAVEAERAAAQERMRAYRAKKKGVPQEASSQVSEPRSPEHQPNERRTNAEVPRSFANPDPSHPDPTRPDPEEDTSADTDAAPKNRQLALVEDRPDVERICQHLAESMKANGVERSITTKWRAAARLMLDKDGRTEEEIHGAIEWSQRDEFWRANILSLPTLREKYDTLRLQAQRKSGSTSRSEEWRSMQERQMARAIEREREMGIQR